MQSGSGRSAKSLGRKRTGSAALTRSRSNRGRGAECGSGAENRPDVAGVLNAGENDEKRSGAGKRRAQHVVERKLPRFHECSDTLGMFGVDDTFEEAIRCV